MKIDERVEGMPQAHGDVKRRDGEQHERDEDERPPALCAPMQNAEACAEAGEVEA
ncbi:hypothetical protein EWM64_g1708 [Hericium alpestre]|uniref:Uncharacterized protein n=1 Tax=Hericium alpestre TaxID=135208 RepID=A0A4Z0A7I6_9AGAM|nr:hypothetical protein EWM64_g1708 [Hericium alpestre]